MASYSDGLYGDSAYGDSVVVTSPALSASNDRWDRVILWGWFMAPDDLTPITGPLTVSMPQRVYSINGDTIYAQGDVFTRRIGDVTSEPAAVALLRAAYKARDQAKAGGSFNVAAWDARWAARLPGLWIATAVALDDVDIEHDPTKPFQMIVREGFAGGLTYAIQPGVAQLPSGTFVATPATPLPGINLATVRPPPGSPVTALPIYVRGVANGLTVNDADGDPINSRGEKVGGTGGPAQLPLDADGHLADTVFPDTVARADDVAVSLAAVEDRTAATYQPRITGLKLVDGKLRPYWNTDGATPGEGATPIIIAATATTPERLAFRDEDGTLVLLARFDDTVATSTGPAGGLTKDTADSLYVQVDDYQPATESRVGPTQFATAGETSTGTLGTKPVSPLRLKGLLDTLLVAADTAKKGLVRLATSAEVTALASASGAGTGVLTVDQLGAIRDLIVKEARKPLVRVLTAARAIAAADDGYTLVVTAATAGSMAIPTGLATDTIVEVVAPTAALTLAPASGVTVRSTATAPYVIPAGGFAHLHVISSNVVALAL